MKTPISPTSVKSTIVASVVAEAIRLSFRAASQASVAVTRIPPMQKPRMLTRFSPVAAAIASSAASGPSRM